ncbi:unnamed protein product [Ranitomeya imitator]|uniref:Uncharacterized protein n=1 Tax=Ranitomeya imitator TaxID=111125 RepID=A0ABN9LXP3_9NEOB|nr:unnamed protein product [Ranitomeya imitator]
MKMESGGTEQKVCLPHNLYPSVTEWAHGITHRDIKEMSPKNKNTHSNSLMFRIQKLNKMTAIANPTFEDILAIETGYTETNL